MKNSRITPEKLDRKTIERNRRIHMKGLCFKLASLIPHHFKPAKDVVSQQDQLDHAAAYITQLKKRIELLKERKSQEMGVKGNRKSLMNTTMVGSRLPVFELRDMGSSLELILISGLNKNFMSYEIISIVEQEGAEVVSASVSTVGDKIFHSLHAQVKISRVGVDTTRICQRLEELIS